MASITKQQIDAACNISSHVYKGDLTASKGVDILATEHGLNPTSAAHFISDYKCLRLGKVFKRAMSAEAMRLFLEHIHTEHGDRGLSSANAALRLHIEYFEKQFKRTARSMRTVLDDMEVRANGTASLQELERSFDVAVANSLHDSRQRRAERLSRAPKTPTSINVQSRVFLRNPDVVAEVLNRASGYCEKCGNKAPFMRASNGNPYLEVHHRRRLADGGEDTVENAFALCPNCHRESHYG